MLSARALGKEKVVLAYRGFSVSADRSKEADEMKKYGKEMMQETAKTYQKWTNELPEKVKDK